MQECVSARLEEEQIYYPNIDHVDDHKPPTVYRVSCCVRRSAARRRTCSSCEAVVCVKYSTSGAENSIQERCDTTGDSATLFEAVNRGGLDITHNMYFQRVASGIFILPAQQFMIARVKSL